MEMEREINSLSDGELDAVAGGRMNNGQVNQLVLKNPDYGVPGSGGSDTKLWSNFTLGVMFVLGTAAIGLA
jgi:hypothetical protein